MQTGKAHEELVLGTRAERMDKIIRRTFREAKVEGQFNDDAVRLHRNFSGTSTQSDGAITVDFAPSRPSYHDSLRKAFIEWVEEEFELRYRDSYECMIGYHFRFDPR